MKGNVKGSLVNMTKQFLTDSFGPDAIDKIAREIGEENAKKILQPIFTFSWLPDKLFVDLLVAADKVYGKGDYTIAERIGYSISKEGVPKLYKVFIEVGNPFFVLKNAPRFWNQLHDNGRLEVTHTATSTATVHIVDKKYPHKAFCRCMIGYIRGVLELSEVKDIQVKETKCNCDNELFCEYVLNWK